MRIGVPREIKTHEYRVGLTPASVRELREHGHEVIVETNAGHAIGLVDALYQNAGARIAADAAEVFAGAELIVKVKDPQAEERARLHEGQVLFTYLHLAPDPEQTRDLMASGCVAIAYETVTDPRGGLPLLAPMSAVAGRMSIQAGAHLGIMKRGSVIVDVAIDQGGCAETSRPTTHADPTYVVDGVVHYCVANMPGAVANTSTFALNNVTLPYVCAIADEGYRQACLADPHLMAGLNVHRGRITHPAVARDLGLPYTPPEQALQGASS